MIPAKETLEMTSNTNTTTRPANAKPWVGAFIYVTEVQDKQALKPGAFIVSEVTDQALKVDGWKSWLPFSRVDYILPDFTTCGGSADDTRILELQARLDHHRARAGELEPASKKGHKDWSIALLAAGSSTTANGPEAHELQDRLAIETGYRDAREAHQYESIMAHLLEEAIETIPANTAQGLAIKSAIAVRVHFDEEGDLAEVNPDTDVDGTNRESVERDLIIFAQTAQRVARKGGVYLADLDLTPYDMGQLSALALHVKEFANTTEEFSEAGVFTKKVGMGSQWDLNDNGRIVDQITQWANQQHNRIMAQIDALEPIDRDEAYERTLARVEWAWRCGVDLAGIAAIVAEGRGQQAAFEPKPSALVQELEAAMASTERKGIELTITLLDEFRRLSPENQGKALKLAQTMANENRARVEAQYPAPGKAA